MKLLETKKRYLSTNIRQVFIWFSSLFIGTSNFEGYFSWERVNVIILIYDLTPLK